MQKPKHFNISTDRLAEQRLQSASRWKSPSYQQRKSLPQAPRASHTDSSAPSSAQTAENCQPMLAGFEELLVYREVFADIIKQDKVYGPLLSTVKSKYDKFVDVVQTDGIQTVTRAQQLKQEVETLRETIAKEKKHQTETLNRLFKDLRESKVEESQCIELAQACQQKGYPVQTLYETRLRKTRSMLSSSPNKLVV